VAGTAAAFAFLGRQETTEEKAVGRQARERQRHGDGRGAGCGGHDVVCGKGGADQAIAGVGDQRHAGVGDQRHPLAGGERPHDLGLGGILRGIGVGHGGRGNAVMAGELGKHTRILAGDQVGFAQDVEGAQRDVAQVADRRGNNMQPRYQRRWFTRRLPIASL
jgi:hypothetical protein